jgi:Predicted nucleotidyltransferases
LPGSIERIMGKAVAALKPVRGIRAVMLGGSRARGNHRADSDMDIGIYYADSDTLDLAALNNVAGQLDDARRRDLIAPPGAWGPWVDGGAWLTVDGLPVDFIFRNVGRVASVIRECRKGIVYANYQPGHPHAFINAMYMGELAIGKLLWEAGSDVSTLKAEAEVYPDALRSACIRSFLFEAEFSGMLAGKSAGRGDIYYVTAHVVRSISCLNQVLFALNREYCLNEKGAVRLVERFAVRPESYGRRVEEIVARLDADARQACSLLDGLVCDVQRLAA